MTNRGTAIVLLGALLLCSADATGSMSRCTWRKSRRSSTRRFDPAHPPQDMPKLAANEAAITVASFGIRVQIQVEVLADATQGQQTTSTVKITWSRWPATWRSRSGCRKILPIT